jgi:hypothetical protein
MGLTGTAPTAASRQYPRGPSCRPAERVLVGVVAEHDAKPAPAQQPRQAPLAVEDWYVPKILTVELEQVEGVQHRLGDGATPVERVEHRDAIRAAHHRLAVERDDLARNSIAVTAIAGCRPVKS